MPETSPFNLNFDKTFLKRVRAWDDNGNDWDIKKSFEYLQDTRYISDGDKNTITVPQDRVEKVKNNYNLKVNTY